MNEQNTVNIVRDKFKESIDDCFIVEEKQSKNPIINKLLLNASKKGSGKGYPEFIVSHREDSSFLIVVECKADIKKHKSEDLTKYADYAIDGALLYASYLSKEFDVIAIGVSGESEDKLLIDSYLKLKKNDDFILFNKGNLNLRDIRYSYVENNIVRNHRYDNLLEYTKQLNEQLHGYKIPENNRCQLLSGILIALENKAFKDSYRSHKTGEDLARNLVESVVGELRNSQIPHAKTEALSNAYTFIKTNRSLLSDKVMFEGLIQDIEQNVNSFYKTYKFYDVFGEFYTEFLRYANKDKGLGIVLTPKHITEFFCELAKITKDSIIFDNCCGTGGFLITAMRFMIAKNNEGSEKEKYIKAKQIIGIEYQDNIFPLLCSNMILHGDGKTNLYNDSCFDLDLITIKNELRPNIGLLNPPYKTKTTDKEEFDFILNNLSGLTEGATCIALIPMSCVLADRGEQLALKKMLLESHTLEAVLSLPDQLFFNSDVGVVTCAVIVTAHKPHKSGHKTWFAYCKSDGFVKRKINGRVDSGKWQEIKEVWLNGYFSKDEIPGFSVKEAVLPNNEWCAEAYMKTDYNQLTQLMFENTVKGYMSFLVLRGHDAIKGKLNNIVKLDLSKWEYFDLVEIFDIKGTKTTHPLLIEEYDAGVYPYVTTQATNNGVAGFYDKYTELGNVLTVDSAIFGYCSYQASNFLASDHVEKLIPKFTMNQYIAMFLVTVINQEQYRYNYGRKASQKRLKASKIKLPAIFDDGKIVPDFQFMENYIKSLPYGFSIPSDIN